MLYCALLSLQTVMITIFKNIKIVSVLYFLILILDICIKVNLGDNSFYRYFSKTVLTILLILLFVYNSENILKIKSLFVIAALAFFLIGDIFFIKGSNRVFFGLGMLCFVIGKLFYILKFAHTKDFKLNRLFPILMISLILFLAVMHFILNSLNELYIHVLLYFFVELMVLIFALLRKENVTKKSYIIVFWGAVLAIISDIITGLKTFSIPGFAYEKITIMLFYAISQYFIIRGLVEERNLETINKIN